PQGDTQRGASRAELYRRLLGLRRDVIMPHLDGAKALGAEPIGASAVLARWRLGDGSTLALAANLGAEPCPLVRPVGDLIFGGDPSGQLAGRTTLAFLERSRG